MDDVKEIEQKLQIILEGFLKPNYKVTNDVYMEMLITHLSGKGEKDYSPVLQSSFILDWIEKCLQILNADPGGINKHVTAFMINVCAIMVPNEYLLIAMRDRELADKIIQFLKTNQDNLTPAIKLAHVNFLSAVSKYGFGLSWIKRTNAWRPLIDYCQKNETVYVVRKAMEVIWDVLYTFSVKIKDETICIEILGEITKPLNENVFSQSSNTVCVDDLDLQRKLVPTLNLICYILQRTIDSEQRTMISYHLEVDYKLEVNLWKLADMTQNQQFLGKMLRTYTTLNYAKLVYEQLLNKDVTTYDFNQFGINFFNLMKFCLVRRNIGNLLMIAELNHILWKKLGNRVPEEIVIEKEKIKFENQLIIFHILPLLITAKDQHLEHAELLDNYIMKLFSVSCDYTLRVCYMFRDVLIECPDCVADLAYKSIHGILSMENILDQDRAVITFQALVYGLKEFAPEGCVYDKPNPKQKTDLVVKTPNLLSAILVGLYSLINRYRITWKESIESTSLLNFMLVLLGNQNLTSRLAVQAIKLTQLSIEHFLSPNLALLVDNFNGSSMEHLGPMIKKRLHDITWEVRDSALELVTSMTCISRLKFPAFQRHILDNGLCPIVVSMAKNDTEPYVRASALKCINQMIVINCLWDNCLSNGDLIDQLLIMLGSETEGIVRREAAKVVATIYEHRKIPGIYLDCVFSTLAHCAVNDLDWEVKINSLHFWKGVICRQLQHQGMIDGTFPTVTFSKENKKIVTLTEKEIFLRIKKVMNELSLRGCLGVILKCLDDDCDLEVVKKAVFLCKKLMCFVNKYDYLKVAETMEANGGSSDDVMQCQSNSIEIEDAVPESHTEENTNNISEDVIESIVSAHDINLLSSAYENQMQVDADSTGNKKIDENLYQIYAKIQPNEFFNKVKNVDFDLIVTKRTEWITSTDSLASLLDDMVYSIKALDVNDADCY